MPTHVDDRDDLEPGAGIISAPPAIVPVNQLIEGVEADPFAGYVDYFGFSGNERWYFPDGKQWLEFRRMNEGERAKFQRMTRPDVTINQKSGDAKVPFDAAKERWELITTSVTDWHVVGKQKNGAMGLVPFSKGSPNAALNQWLVVADPVVVTELERAIRKANPWMTSEMSVDQIDKEIANLEEMKKDILEREASEKNS
jgi:hypothetical protein